VLGVNFVFETLNVWSVPVGLDSVMVSEVTVNAGHSLDTVQGWINLDGPGSNDLHFAYYAVVGH
jgi:hypothetical protein